MDAGDAVAAMLDRARTIPEHIGQLRLLYPNLTVGVFLWIAPKDTDLALFFEPATVAKIAALGAFFDIEFFDLPEADDPPASQLR